MGSEAFNQTLKGITNTHLVGRFRALWSATEDSERAREVEIEGAKYVRLIP